MSLQEKLSEFKGRFESGEPPFDRVPSEVHEIMKRAVRELAAAGAAEKVLKAGRAPAFELSDANGELVHLHDLLGQGPVVLSFYRGVWCPYCNLDLQELELFAGDIRAAGATLVAVSPQTPANSRKSIAEHGLSFPILSDPFNRVADRYGLRHALPDYLINVFKRLGVDLSVVNGEGSWTLPSPGRFVIDRQGQIRYAESHPDYTRRPEPRELLPILQGLNAAGAA